jgi:hypothetical protein
VRERERERERESRAGTRRRTRRGRGRCRPTSSTRSAPPSCATGPGTCCRSPQGALARARTHARAHTHIRTKNAYAHRCVRAQMRLCITRARERASVYVPRQRTLRHAVGALKERDKTRARTHNHAPARTHLSTHSPIYGDSTHTHRQAGRHARTHARVSAPNPSRMRTLDVTHARRVMLRLRQSRPRPHASA